MRGLAVLMILLACVFIALGRRQRRRVLRRVTPASPQRRGRLWGWLLTAFGFLLMLAGVAIW